MSITNKTVLLRQKISLILFGLFLTLAILEIGLRIAGFTILALQEHRNLQSIKQKGEFRIMCLGESTTQNQYPAILEDILNQRNIGIKFSVIDKGLAGTKTTVILALLETNLNKYKPDMIITMMGVNDDISREPNKLGYDSKLGAVSSYFKVYKLIKLLELHFAAKLEEAAQKEQIAIENMKLNSNDDSACAELGRIYRDRGEFEKAEQAFKKALELNPNNDSAYIGLGKIYIDEQELEKAEQAFKKALELNPNSDSAYIGLSRFCLTGKNFKESEEMFKKALMINPNNDAAYIEMGKIYRTQGKFSELEQMLMEILKLYPNNYSAYRELGKIYRDRKEFEKSEVEFKKVLELNPYSNSAYEELGKLYRDQGKFEEAEKLFKKALESYPEDDRVNGGLATLYYETGNTKLYDFYTEKVNKLRKQYYIPITISNYHKLKQIADRKNIKLVCVQYPIRSIVPLKRIFKEEEGIIFVDNEKIFKDVIRKKSYNEYFMDMFGGDFGHCNLKGNRLLAENIANVILKEYFNK